MGNYLPQGGWLLVIREALFVAAIGVLFWALFDPHTNPPEISSGTAALAAGALGVAVNPKNKTGYGVRTFMASTIFLTTGTLVIVSAIWLFLYDSKVAASVFAASLAAVGGLSVDTSAYVSRAASMARKPSSSQARRATP